MAFVAPPGYQPIYSPSIPYLGPIFGGLRAGTSLYIQGVIPHHITRFQINLQCGQMPGSDIALHFNPRFDGWDKVVFNTFQNGAWEGEEKIRKMPFKKGENFELVIVANTEGYQVNVNGRQFHLFQHRMPMERVCFLEIGGDVSVQTINIIGGGYPVGGVGGCYPTDGMDMGGCMPSFPPDGMGGGVGYPGGNLPVMGGEPMYNPPVPFSNLIPGGMSPKRTIVIRGMVRYEARRFEINFIAGFSRDIAFHFNPRIAEGIVVRNSLIGGSWGMEETEINFNPFQMGQYFDISVRCGRDRYKIFVDGQHMCDFYHRLQPFTQVDTIEIKGDVQLSYIHF